MTLDLALESLKNGKFILLYDSKKRENEIDMVIPAQYTTPQHVAQMRQYAGGLVCIATDGLFAQKLRLEYMHNILKSSTKFTNKDMIQGIAPYGDHPTFSITINHKETFTGITDLDRTRTITEFSKLYNDSDPKTKFESFFKTPGHIPLLIADTELLAKRKGHTEMSVYLAKLANLIPVMVICEMMDSQTYTALSKDKAKLYAKQNNIPIITSDDLLEQFMVKQF